MAQRIEAKEVTVAASTLKSAPAVTALPFADGIVTRIEVRVPPGPSGLAGFQVRHSGQRIIPRRDDIWIVADDEPLDWSLSDYPTGGAWQLAAYNTDIYPHTFYLRFHLDEIGMAAPGAVPIVPVVQEAPALAVGVPNVEDLQSPYTDETPPLIMDEVPA